VVEAGHNRDSIEEAYPTLPFVWLDTTSDSGKVFLLRRTDLPH
jgi:ribosomal protein L3 glutamine methyltransferase